jgi:hypothetical protein
MCDVAGPQIFGRALKASEDLRAAGEARPLLHVFKGGSPGSDRAKKWGHRGGTWDDQMVFEVLGMAIAHEGEFRLWRPDVWGMPAVGGDLGQSCWKKTYGIPINERFFDDRLLDIENPARSTIWYDNVGRDMVIACLPELLLHWKDERSASVIYQEWLKAEIVIRRKHRRGTTPRARPWMASRWE